MWRAVDEEEVRRMLERVKRKDDREVWKMVRRGERKGRRIR